MKNAFGRECQSKVLSNFFATSLRCQPRYTKHVTLPSETLHVVELGEIVRSIGLNSVAESEFVPLIASAGILNLKHVRCGVKAIYVPKYDDLPAM